MLPAAGGGVFFWRACPEGDGPLDRVVPRRSRMSFTFTSAPPPMLGARPNDRCLSSERDLP